MVYHKGNIMKKLLIVITNILSLSIAANMKLIKSETNFSATGKPAFIKANGNAPLTKAIFQLLDNKLSGMAEVDLRKLDSGIELRDEHLKKKYLHTDKFPVATLVIPKQKVDISGKMNKLKATLNFHGAKNEILLDTSIEKSGNKLSVISNFKILLTDYAVTLPSFQGITAADKVKLRVKTEFEL